MKIPDLNVLVGAFRADAEGHGALRRWLEQAVSGGELLGLRPAVSTGVVRLLTHPRIFAHPDPVDAAIEHIAALRENPQVIDVLPGPRHGEIFARLCRDADARGNLVSDAAIAAVAIEHNATVVTLDRDFARFPALRWELPRT